MLAMMIKKFVIAIVLMFISRECLSNFKTDSTDLSKSIGIEISTIGFRYFRPEISDLININYFNSFGLNFSRKRFSTSLNYEQFKGIIEANQLGKSEWKSGSDLKFGIILLETGYAIIDKKRFNLSIVAGAGISRAVYYNSENGQMLNQGKSEFKNLYKLGSSIEYVPTIIPVKDAFFHQIAISVIGTGAFYSNFAPNTLNMNSQVFQLCGNIGIKFLW